MRRGSEPQRWILVTILRPRSPRRICGPRLREHSSHPEGPVARVSPLPAARAPRPTHRSRPPPERRPPPGRRVAARTARPAASSLPAGSGRGAGTARRLLCGAAGPGEPLGAGGRGGGAGGGEDGPRPTTVPGPSVSRASGAAPRRRSPSAPGSGSAASGRARRDASPGTAGRRGFF